MFSRSYEKPLPPATVVPLQRKAAPVAEAAGILLGQGVYWNPERLPNGHIVVIGASGSGKTQTIKGIFYALLSMYMESQKILIDFHGDQDIEGEVCYPLHMASPWGINPLSVNLDPEGGGPNLQAIQAVSVLKKSLQLGSVQEGMLLGVLQACYRQKGIVNEDAATWNREAPNFGDVEQELQHRDEQEDCKESRRLRLKLAATFQYGVFSRPQFPLDAALIRVDLSKLPPALQSIAAESLAKQVMDRHRLLGEMNGKVPRTFLGIDEAKEMPNGKGAACDRIIADGRKYGLALCLASQSERHLSLDVIGNSSTKIVLPVDQTEVTRVAKKFRFAEAKVAALQPLQALVRFGTDARPVEIVPYYARVQS
ncbi:ATP-binding protein [Rivularia sp. UHCC 0363]|uniref:ATP-binding protein n=1 Tax=Rivularia sp. UHCC 0363 TaxID=3110244 RepID=UPI002B1F392A|nr:ATP-binding protein [Rivularia sp. UHCC 0363]MEA5597371.1 ATP-binding protein [Rivularia sp. UHCC 0363]